METHNTSKTTDKYTNPKFTETIQPFIYKHPMVLDQEDKLLSTRICIISSK